MSILKYINRLHRMDDLLCRRATGNASQFAEKLGISRSQLLQDLKELRELGAPIKFCSISQSYCYTLECSLKIPQIKGGKNMELSSITGFSFCSFLTQEVKASIITAEYTEKRK